MRDIERNIVWGTKPPQSWLDLAEFKMHARITNTAEDTMIQARLESASQHIEKMVGKCLVPTEFDVYFNRFPRHDYSGDRALYLGLAPVLEIDLFEYEQIDGTMITLVPDVDYYASLKRSNPYVTAATMTTGIGCWPGYDLAYNKPDIIHIHGTAGYETQADIPVNLKWAAYMLTTLWYQCREGSNPNIEYKDIPGYASIEALVGPYRRAAI